jgi:hypothetical protein
MINKKQAAFLRSLNLDGRPSGLDPSKRKIADEINNLCADAIIFLYAGSIGGSQSEFPYRLTYRAQNLALSLLREYEKTEIVGYAGRIQLDIMVNGSYEQEYHFRAKSVSALRGQIKRSVGWRKFEILTMDTYTHEEWCMAFGYGRM